MAVICNGVLIMGYLIFVVETLANLSQSGAMLYFLIKILKIKSNIDNKMAALFGGIFFFLYLELQYIIVPFEGLGVLLLWVLLFLYSYIFLDGSIWLKLYISLFIIIVMLFTTILVGSISGAVYGSPYIEFVLGASYFKYISICILQVIIWIIIYYLTHTVIKNSSNTVNIKNTIHIILTMVIAIVIMSELQNILQQVMVNRPVKEALIIIMGVTAMLISCIELYSIAKKSTKKEMEQKIIEQAYKNQLKNIDEIKAVNEQILRVRHEYNRTFSIVSTLINAGNINEAQEFLSQFDKEINKIVVNKIYTDNVIINSLLVKKVEECHTNNIDILPVINGMNNSIKSVDLYFLLSNLIDNAIEAEKDICVKRIEVIINANDKLCSIKISNNINSKMRIKYEKGILFKTQKSDETLHGYGIKNVKNIVDLYHGKIKYDISENNVLTCSVLLYSEKFTTYDI